MDHTPGPWTIEGKRDPKKASYISHGDWTVCDVLSVDLPRGKANMALIAAAPDLLEACRSVLATMDRDDEAAYDPCAPGKQTVGQMLRAAIAKAEGRQ